MGIEQMDSIHYPEIVINALALTNGPLKVCIDYDLSKVLATPQLITHVDNVFRSSLKSKIPVRDVYIYT